MKLFYISVVFLLLFPLILLDSTVHAELSTADAERRNKLRQALSDGILNGYDIPFETALRLEMWDELRYILRVNNDHTKVHRFPGKFYTRPFVVKDRIWVFDNQFREKGGIFVFDPDTLESKPGPGNPGFLENEGSIRKIVDGRYVVSGGTDTDRDVDSAVIWDTEKNTVNTVKLQSGHYVGSIHVEKDKLFIGSCGETINAWNFNDLSFSGNFLPAGKHSRQWDEMECITAINILGNKVLGVGEKTVFFWDLKTRKPIGKTPKKISDSMVLFYKNILVEYKHNRCILWNPINRKILGKIKAANPIEDLIVSGEKILRGVKGPVLILSLHHNQGLSFFKFPTGKFLKTLKVKGVGLAAYKGAIFTTDDRNLYRHDVFDMEPEKYSAYIHAIDPEKWKIDDKGYSHLMDIFGNYPWIIKDLGFVEHYLKRKKLSVDHAFRFGKFTNSVRNRTHRFSDGKSTQRSGYPGELTGYIAEYSVDNTSRNHYLVTMQAAWFGEYGNWSGHTDREIVHKYTFSFPIGPNGDNHSDRFFVGEKEPTFIFFYPVRIRKVSEEYFRDFKNALDPVNEDMELVERFLGDADVKSWHPALQQKKDHFEQKKKKRFFLFRFF